MLAVFIGGAGQCLCSRYWREDVLAVGMGRIVFSVGMEGTVPAEGIRGTVLEIGLEELFLHWRNCAYSRYWEELCLQ